MKLQIPSKVSFILDSLEAAGFEAYAVGGCVRDALLGREPEDWDITTSAKPEQVKSVFRRTIDTGIKHGTVTVMIDKEGFEVTTYRIDGEYEDGRHPKEVSFTSNLEEDLKRRDFTINAMAYNDKSGIVDLFGGQEDLKRKVIRCVGCANERFEEDALRMLRAVRFSGQLGFEIENETKAAIKELSLNLKKVSWERIQTELTKLLISPHPEHMLTAYETGLTAQFIPEFDAIMKQEQRNPYHCYTVGMHTVRMIEQIPATKILRLTALLHDVGKPLTHSFHADGTDHFENHAEISAKQAKKILIRLRFDNDTINAVTKLISYHDYHFRRDKKIIRRAMSLVGKDLFIPLMEVMRADTLAKSEYTRQERLDDIQAICKLHEEILNDNECVCLKDLAVNGNDLIEYGIRPGKQLGVILQLMLDEVLENPKLNRQDLLLERLPDFVNRE